MNISKTKLINTYIGCDTHRWNMQKIYLGKQKISLSTCYLQWYAFVINLLHDVVDKLAKVRWPVISMPVSERTVSSYIVHGAKIWVYWKILGYIGAYLLKRTTFWPISCRSCTHIGVTCISSDFSGILPQLQVTSSANS